MTSVQRDKVNNRKQQDSDFERYYNNHQSDGINYEAAYEQLQQQLGRASNNSHSISDYDATTATEDDEDEENYRKVPIKDLINSFENQSRPVMRYKLADEQIIRKVYRKQYDKDTEDDRATETVENEETVAIAQSSKNGVSLCQETIPEEREVPYPGEEDAEALVNAAGDQEPINRTDYQTKHPVDNHRSSDEGTDKEQPNYDSDARQGISTNTRSPVSPTKSPQRRDTFLGI